MENGNEISRRQFIIRSTAVAAMASTSSIMQSQSNAGTETRRTESCEVLVCGATPAGIAAAVAAARWGHDVILAEYEDHIGGIVANGLTNTDLRPTHRAAVGGFFDELCDRVVAHYREMDKITVGRPNVRLCRDGFAYEPSVIERIFNEFVDEQGGRIRVLLRHELKGAVTEENQLKAAVFEPRDFPGSGLRIDARVLIDATYEGDLAAMAKARFRLGREGRQEFDEPHAGRIYMTIGSATPLPGSTGEGDKAIQSYCFRFTATTNRENQVQVEKPGGYDRADYKYLLADLQTGKLSKLSEIFGVFPMPNGKVEFNSLHPVPSTGLPSESLDLAEDNWSWPEATPAERRKIYERYLTHNVGMLWLLQNDPEVPESLRQDALRYGWCKDEFVGNQHIPRQVYVREGRRIEGEYLLTEHDGFLAQGLERTRVQPTSIALAEWRYDCHSAHRYDPAHPGVREGYTFAPDNIFQIPYGVLVPKSIDSLLVPVACSATHIAYGAVRNEPIFMALGQACGVAAHLAIENGTKVREVSVPRLQKDLVEDGARITYLEDIQGDLGTVVAFQWLGARGFNSGYRADLEKPLTRGEAAERLQRVLRNLGPGLHVPVSGDPSSPLKYGDVASWLQSAGFTPPKQNLDAIEVGPASEGMKCMDFARMIYSALATA